LKSQKKRVAIAIVVAVVVVLVVEAATEVAAEEVVMTVLEILGRELKAEDAEATAIRLAADLHDDHQALNQVVVAIFQEQEKAVDNKPMC